MTSAAVLCLGFLLGKDTPFANSPYYYENNFNSYPEGLVTLFELLVVNNW